MIPSYLDARKRGVIMSPSPHKETRAYFARLKANGVTATIHQQRSFDDFVRIGKLGGWLSTIQRLFLPVWGVAAANAVDAVLPSRSGTWVGTVSHANKCATGTTGALDSTWVPSTSGTTWPNIGIMLQTTTLLSEPAVLCGGPGGTGQTQMDQYDNVRTLFNIGSSASGQIIAAYTTDQLIYGYGLTNNTKNLVTSVNGAAGKRDSNAIVDGDYPTLPMYFMASNLGAISLPSARGFGMMGITHGVNSDAMAVSVASAVNTLVNKLRA